MIRLKTTRAVYAPLPIRTATAVSLPRTTKVTRRNGVARQKVNHRSVETVQLIPGQHMDVPDSWADLADVRLYQARGMLTVTKLADKE